METLTIDHLNNAAAAGGSSVLTSVTRLEPAAGAHASIAPARYVKGGNSTYVYQDRYLNGASQLTVLVDSKSSVANRMEDALNDAITNGHDVLAKMPRIGVTYKSADWERRFTCLTLPHRGYDAHIRFGTVAGKPTSQVPAYVAARNSDPSNALAMANLSFGTVAFGGWDSSRKARQARFPSIMVGEIIGVLANQDSAEPRPEEHSGARVDPVAMGLELSSAQIADLLKPQAHEYSPKLLKKKTLKPSSLGLGGIPPQADGLAGIATREILRSHVLSFAMLRRMRFGMSNLEGDAAMRVLIAAVLLNAMARSDGELFLRANCHLTEAGAPEVRLDMRHGKALQLAPITVEAADSLLEAAYSQAKKHGIDWNGVSLQVDGNPTIFGAIDDGSDDD